MKYKRLSKAEIEEMKVMVQKGTAPEDLARHFGIAISSVHNYKKQFKADGVEFPNVKGKRPTGMAKPSGVVAGKNQVAKTDTPQPIHSGYMFVVNGVSVQVDGTAKNVVIGNGTIQIDF